MNKRFLALFLAFVMILGMLPTSALATDGSDFDSFFSHIEEVADVTNDTTSPFVVETTADGGPWLQSSTAGKNSSTTTITLTFRKAATLTFSYRVSSEAKYDGMLVKNGDKTLYTYSNYDSDPAVVKNCSGEAEGIATINANVNDTVTISYRKDSGGKGGEDCLRLKDFAYTLPNQVTFHANNGTDETTSQGIFGTGTLINNTFSYAGHIFKGWATSEERASAGTVDYSDGATFSLSQDSDLYAVWAAVYDLSFTLSPEDMTFALYRDEEHTDKLTPNDESHYTYTLENGNYYFIASRFGYTDSSGEVTLSDGAQTVPISLRKNPVEAVTFSYSGADAASIEGGSLTVSTADGVHTIMPSAGGTSVYELPVGYRYTYTFRSTNYARVSDTIDLTDISEAGSRSISIPLLPKSAWEGDGDISPVTPDDVGIYHIRTGAELAWFAGEVNRGALSSASAVLEADIDLGGENWTPIGTSSYRFTGRFDGQGYEISNLRAEGTNYIGLFGLIGSDGTVSHLTVASGGVAGTKYIGGIAGRNEGTITRCVNHASVSSNGTNASVYTREGAAGGITGHNTGTIRMCANFGAVNVENGGYAGGIAGFSAGNWQAEAIVENVYNAGEVYAQTLTGGIFGATYSYSTLNKAYNRGAVTGTLSYGIGDLIGNAYSYKVTSEDVYYLSGRTPVGTNAENLAASSVNDRTEMVEMLAGKVGAFVADTSPALNEGWPILGFQDPNATFNLTLTVSPADATISLQQEGTSVSLLNPSPVIIDGKAVYTFSGLSGKYSYTVSHKSYVTQNGEVTISGESIALSAELVAKLYDTTFTVSPAEAELTLTDGEGNVLSGTKQDGADSSAVWSFQLPDGTYRYTVSALGWTPVRDTLVINGAGAQQALSLAEAPNGKVTLQIAYSDGNPNSVTPEVIISHADQVIPAEGDSYTLPYATYHYLIKAKGYGRAEGDFTVSTAEMTLPITLSPSVSWDGVEVQQPRGSGTDSDPYLLETGAELAWMAQQINGSSSSSYRSKFYQLGADIDLGGEIWTPIGTSSSSYFAGNFDGAGHTISGLRVETAGDRAGLFGYAKGNRNTHAIIQNLTVEGSVTNTSTSYTNYTGGIIGYADYTELLNCHNRADVTGGSNFTGGVAGYLYNGGGAEDCSNTGTISAPKAEHVGGVIGNAAIFGTSVSVSRCFNTGDVTGKTKVGGVIGTISGAVSDLYNTGTVTGAEAVGGILGYQGGDISYAYNIGKVTGDKDVGAAFGRVSSFYDRNQIYYLDTLTAADTNAEGIDSTALRALVPTLNGDRDSAIWKSSPSQNDGYPIFIWQNEDSGETGGGPLQAVSNAVWQTNPSTGLLTGVASWDAVPHADSYTVVLWDYWSRETKYGAENGLSPIKEITGVTDTQYDFTSDIEANGASWYYFTVTPIASAGSSYESGTVPKTEADAYAQINFLNSDSCYRYTEQLTPPTGLRWMEGFAHWNHVDGAFGYLVMLYRLDESDTPNYVASGLTNGSSNTFDCTNYFAVGGRYIFRVIALSEEYVVSGVGDKNSPESLPSNDAQNAGATLGVYTATALPVPDPEQPDRSDWIAISSAEDWMELANIEDIPVDDDSPNSSKQAEAWGKKYYLTADLDFSSLSAADQARTKSIGTVQNRFTGTLDGNGHKITGLTLSNYDSGLFTYIGATGYVYDLEIEGANVLFSDNAAVLALNNYGTIRDCAITNCNITADTGAVLGGLVSRNYGRIEGSYVRGGTLKSNSITATGHAGFVGANETGGIIERCWSSMDVNTSSSYAGGFVGLSYGGVIRDCFALGDVSAAEYSGGFAGRSVFSGNAYQNCYAAGTLTVSGEGGHGFIGGSKPDSAFIPDLSTELTNCYYRADSPEDSYATGLTLAEMQSAEFLIKLNGTGSVWIQTLEKNSGLPYLNGVDVPEELPSSTITVEIAVAIYDKESYSFSQKDKTVSVTLESNGNTRVVDVMDAAARDGLLTYSYETTPNFGRFIHTINGYAVDAPDGWMFMINDQLSNVSASLATLEDGDRLLWFEGTTENHFQGPLWDDLTGTPLEWTDISSVDELLALANSTDNDLLKKNYRLTGDLNLSDIGAFPGIGSEEHPFTGIFDGQGNTLSNITITGNASATGFFNVIKGATVKNLNLINVTVSGTDRVGGLVGWSQAELDSKDLSKNIAGLIGNCSVNGSVNGTDSIGGLVGCNDGVYDKDTLFSIDCTIDKCAADVSVSGSGSGSKIGGLVGENKGTITKSAAIGNVSAPSSTTVGGFAGDSTGDIYDSHAEGDVSGFGTVGGFAGYSSGIVKNCYSLGNVSGRESTGGFAGAISAAENTISAGYVTISGTSSTGYNGGFTGRLSGQLTGIENQITIKNSYGNCIQVGATPLNVVGNSSSFQGEAQQAVLSEMTLVTPEAVSEKLYEMFGVNLKGSDALAPEAEKYRDSLLVTSDTAVGTALSLLKEGQLPNQDITVSFVTDNSYLIGGTQLILFASNETSGILQLPVTLVLSDSSGNIYRKTIHILLQAPESTTEALMDAIAATLTDSSDSWTVMDMLVYRTLAGKTHTTTASARQNALNLLINSAAGDQASVSDRARFEITLRSMGIDSTKLYPVNSNYPFNNAEKLAKMDLASGGYYAAPWILLADLQGNLNLSEGQIDTLIALLKQNVGDGLFGYEYDGVTYTDPDTAGIALAALAPFYGQNADATALVDTILTALPGALNQSGSLGNANADAIVITGLIALGKDPSAFQNIESGASLVDGLLSWANDRGDAFQYPNFITGALEDNALATEQGFRALIALEKFDGTTPYNIYDFSKNTVVPGRATGTGEVAPPTDPDTDKTIQVTFSLKTDTEIWIPITTITVKEGSTVYHAFVKALEMAGDMSAVGAESGYVKSITKGNVTLSEFDKGAQSGWLYKINGQVPNISLTSYTLSANDDILWYYTTDWSEEPGIGGGDSDSDNDNDDDDGDDTDKLPFVDVDGHWGYDAIRYVYEHGLMNGIDTDIFSPDSEMTRAMLVTVLYRMEGSPAVHSSNAFIDVEDGAWYASAVLWASGTGIINGVGDDKFAPDVSVTREQMATMLLRYANWKGYDVSASSSLDTFIDTDEIGDWALAAMRWAHAEGLIYGRTENTIVPQGTATRAEIATILMRFLEGINSSSPLYQ